MAINKEVNTSMLLTIPKDLKEKIFILAKKDNRSATNYVLNLLQKHVDEIEIEKII